MNCFTGKFRPLLLLSVLVFWGIVISFFVAQLLWINSNNSRLVSYSEDLLRRADFVADNLTSALNRMHTDSIDECSNSDISKLKYLVFTHNFVKDAGVVNNNKVICSALWGDIPDSYEFKGDHKLTKNNITLWKNIPSYAMQGTFIDVSSKGNVFVVTSPHAFLAYENKNNGIKSKVTSTDGAITLRSFGNEIIPTHSLISTNHKVCSGRYDFCVSAQYYDDLLSHKHYDLLLIILFCGSAIGYSVWYILKQNESSKKSIETKLLNALNSNDIYIEYQPIVNMETYKLHGIEALARWQDKNLGNIPPIVFIKKIEEMGISNQFNKYMVSKAMRECADFLAANPDTYLSLNIDCDFLTFDSSISFLIDSAKKNNIPPKQIAFEILENSTVDFKTLNDRLDTLRKLDFHIFIDDFGTGYSSLAYLSALNFDKIKIDRTFTHAAGTYSPTEKVLEKINEIAATMSVRVIFEGVETEVQRQAILAFNPQALAQGWLISKSVPLEQIKSQY